MQIRVRFFAGLRERTGISETALSVPENSRTGDVWALAVPQESVPDNTLVAKNMEYVGLDESVEEGDEIAFFPPVTGGGW